MRPDAAPDRQAVGSPGRSAEHDRALVDAVAALRTARTAVVCGHINPDGDALGSLFSITEALRSMGVDAQPTWGGRDATDPPAALDPALSFLPLPDEVRHGTDVHAAPDVLVCCDTAAAARLGTLQPLLDQARTTIVVDHHASGEPFGDIRLVDSTASSTGILALELIDALGVAVSPAMADALYLAILTDTGRFGFSSTQPQDLRAAARLMEAGADHVGVARAVYESASPAFLGMVASMTARAEIGSDLVWAYTTLSDAIEHDARDHDSDGLIDLLRRVDAADVVLLLRETQSGRWRSSLRSRGSTDVAAIAETFGGGGHRLAAGFTADGDPHQVAARIRRLLGAEPATPQLSRRVTG